MAGSAAARRADTLAGMEYHRLAADRAWWRHLLGALLIIVAWFVAGGLALGLAEVLYGPLSPLADLVLTFGGVALLLPATWLGVRALQGRGLGTLSSITGRLRLAWLVRCLVPAGAVVLVIVAAMVALEPPAEPFAPFTDVLRTMAALVLLVPLQAAAEEYLFRGYLLQAFGRFARRPYLPILLQAVLFAAIHGWGTPWGFIDLVVFGAVAGWLTVRTGGLEAAIALHVLNNLAATVLVALTGDLRIDETAADLPWPMVAVDVPLLIVFALVVDRMARPIANAVVAQPGIRTADSPLGYHSNVR